MPDDEGFLLPGELGGGGYSAFEGDLGVPLRPLAGFGRELSEPDGTEEEFEGFFFDFVPEGVRTRDLPVRFFIRGFDA